MFRSSKNINSLLKTRNSRDLNLFRIFGLHSLKMLEFQIFNLKRTWNNMIPILRKSKTLVAIRLIKPLEK